MEKNGNFFNHFLREEPKIKSKIDTMVDYKNSITKKCNTFAPLIEFKVKL